MFLLDLFEAPIADIQTHGDFTQPGSLRADDLSLATAKRQDKIKRVLQKTPIEIDLHILNMADPVKANGNFDIRYHLTDNRARVGYLQPSQVAQYWTPITPRPQALNLLYVQNEGDDRLPLTPWIIAHRLSHAFEYAEPLLADKLFKAFLSALEEVQDSFPHQGAAPPFHQLAWLYGTTKACRERMIRKNRSGEWFHDCFAQMCVTGDIRFNVASRSLPNAVVVNDIFERLRTKLLSGFRAMLDNSVGQILVL